jgi:hypothetical protein
MADIIATVGSASANSFATEDEFADYLDARLNAGTYTAASKIKALIEATRDLDLLDYVGERVNATQALSWPRADAPNPDAPVIDSATGAVAADFEEDEIPVKVINATCELAYQYLVAGTTDIASLDSTASIKREKVGPLETEYAEPVSRPVGLSRFPRVMNYVRPLLKGGGSSAPGLSRV